MLRALFRFLVVFVAVSSSAALAQNTTDSGESHNASGGQDSIQLHSWAKEFHQKDNLAILYGNVRVTGGDLTILADAVVAWLKEDNSGVTEVYAEGNVLLTNGKDRITAQAVYYNFETGTARIARAWVQTTQYSLNDLVFSQRTKESGPPATPPKPDMKIYFRAESLRTERPTCYVAEEILLSTCEFADPHWGLRCRRARVYPEGTLEASGNRLFVGPVTIPFFNVRFEPDWRMPLQRLRTGSSSDKGNFTLSRWQLVIEPGYRLFFDLDSYQKNGYASGGTFEYEGRGRPWSGYFQTYAINDRNPPSGIKHYRYRLKFLHLQNLPGDVGLAVEYSKTSDGDFIKQYFDREYKKGRKQETYAYLRKTWRNLGFRLLASLRTEDFRTSVQYEPQLRTDALSQELPGDFYLTVALRNEKMRREYADSLALPDETVERHDALMRLNRPITLGRFLTVKPGMEARFTHYNLNAVDSQNVDREVVAVNCTAATQVSRNYARKVEWLGIDGLKHVVEPEITYQNIYENDVRPASLIQFDEIDAIDKEEVFIYSLTNRFDTRRVVEGERVTVNILDWRLRASYYPKPRRDNGGEVNGPLESRLEISLSPYFTARSDLTYNTSKRHMSEGSANLTFRNPGTWELYLGTLYSSGESTIGTLGFSAELSPKWQASVRLQHDLTLGRYVSKTFTLTRKFHCWTMEMGVILERDRDKPTYVFMISPAALFKKDKLQFTEESVFLK
jgi:LPS-assembly protein